MLSESDFRYIKSSVNSYRLFDFNNGSIHIKGTLDSDNNYIVTLIYSGVTKILSNGVRCLILNESHKGVIFNSDCIVYLFLNQ